MTASEISETRFFLRDEFSSRSWSPHVSASTPSMFTSFLLLVFVLRILATVTLVTSREVPPRSGGTTIEGNGSSRVCVDPHRSSVSDMVPSSGENEEHRYRESVLQLYFTETQTREDANQKIWG